MLQEFIGHYKAYVMENRPQFWWHNAMLDLRGKYVFWSLYLLTPALISCLPKQCYYLKATCHYRQGFLMIKWLFNSRVRRYTFSNFKNTILGNTVYQTSKTNGKYNVSSEKCMCLRNKSGHQRCLKTLWCLWLWFHELTPGGPRLRGQQCQAWTANDPSMPPAAQWVDHRLVLSNARAYFRGTE